MSSNFASCISRQRLSLSLLKAVGRKDVEIRGEPKIKTASSCVDGLTSIVLRVEVSYGFQGDDTTTKTEFFVVKCIPKIDLQIQLVRTCNLFVREGRYFQEVVPILEKVSKGKVEIPLPNCYHAVYEGDSEAIFMEDLAKADFQTPSATYRSDGLDLQHCLVAMETLGKLHALSIAGEKEITPQKGGWISMIPVFSKDALFFDQIPGEPPAPFSILVEKRIEYILYVSKQIEGLPKEAEECGKLEMISKKIWDILVKLVKPNNSGRNVLNHGDCWMNNMMYRYEQDSNGKQQPVDAKFIDFQIVRYCSPCIDLLHFIYMGTTKPFRELHLNRLINEYYDSLEKTLKILNIATPPFTLDELKDGCYGKYKTYGVIVGAVFAPALRLGEDFLPSTKEEMTPEEFEEICKDGQGGVMRKRFLEDPVYRSKVEDAVREFVDTAFPDGLENTESSPMLQ